MRTGTCVRIGHGSVAAIHERVQSSLGIHTIGVLEAALERRALAAQAGHRVLSTYADALEMRPTFWDICVDTSRHVEVMSEILSLDPGANILIEKPVCSPSGIPLLRRMVAKAARARIVVNENYRSSAITTLVQQIAFEELRLRPRRILIEMTKDRSRDFEEGRFIDTELEAFGYEGPHMVATVQMLGSRYMPFRFVGASLEDMVIGSTSKSMVLPRQGSAHVHYLTQEGVEVELSTSLDAAIRNPCPLPRPFGDGRAKEQEAKHRLLAIEGIDERNDEYSVVGFFEPIRWLSRLEGAVVTLRNGKIVGYSGPIRDDTMEMHMRRAVRYFLDEGPNPADLESSIEVVEVLQKARSFAVSRHGVSAARPRSAPPWA